MATSSESLGEIAFKEPGENPVVHWALVGLGLLFVLGIAWFLYVQLTGTLTTKVKDDQPVQMTEMLPPPLPPPPPPPPPPPEVKPPEPSDAPKPTPEPAAAPKPDAPAPMTVAADAQAGNDAFGLQAGSGGGMGGGGAGGTCVKPPCGTGGGIGDGLYKNMLKRAIQTAISGDKRVNKFVFTNNFAIVVTPAGRITAVELRSGSGKANIDKMLTEILQGLSVPPPPVKSQYPVVIQVRGRSQFGG
ncbi:hypothetical protein [Sphingomonas sp.]|uniref:hypothetical protein n=1 Tax=Sphingomonas sp. TaxID=28214 RepID=UPI0025D1C779|nr:hypothetical protein [Sphingomonas sp.]